MQGEFVCDKEFVLDIANLDPLYCLLVDWNKTILTIEKKQLYKKIRDKIQNYINGAIKHLEVFSGDVSLGDGVEIMLIDEHDQQGNFILFWNGEYCSKCCSKEDPVYVPRFMDVVFEKYKREITRRTNTFVFDSRCRSVYKVVNKHCLKLAMVCGWEFFGRKIPPLNVVLKQTVLSYEAFYPEIISVVYIPHGNKMYVFQKEKKK